MKDINVLALARETNLTLKAGEKILLSGEVYTARDAAHKKIMSLVEKNESLPFDIKGAVIYYAGPTGTPRGLAIGSCGPTTSSRMDIFTPILYDMGLAATIGKGGRSQEVAESISRNCAVYLCAIGGAGALAAERIEKCEVIAFPELGCESVKRLTFNKFPLIVGISAYRTSLFN